MSLSAPCTTRSRIAGIERTRTLPPSFGISCRRAGNGAYVRLTSLSLICTKNASTPCASMAVKGLAFGGKVRLDEPFDLAHARTNAPRARKVKNKREVE